MAPESPIDMDQARFLAMCTASESSAIYGWRFRKVAMALETVGADERADHYLVTLSFRPQGQFGSAPGLQEISIAKEGNVAGRRVVRLPESPAKSCVPVPLIGIGLAVVGVVVAAGVFAAVQSGGNESSSSEILSASTVVPATASPVDYPKRSSCSASSVFSRRCCQGYDRSSGLCGDDGYGGASHRACRVGT